MRKTIPIAVGLGFMALSSQGLAAPPEIEEICFHEAAQRSFNGRGEREQFITNCIADLTATPPRERRRYKKRRY